ncbi:hypothetical protein BM7_CDS0091 [Klebsiella phage Kpn BM7]|nr:hypothetical protein BM7_CDS0091 [Klebsiella phage Kpn BM7]
MFNPSTHYVNPLPHLRSTLLQVGKATSLRGLDVHEERSCSALLGISFNYGLH